MFSCAELRVALDEIGTDNAQGEKYLTDAALRIQASGGCIEAMPTADPWLVAGVNDRVQLGAAAAELNRLLVAHWQREGVTVQDPLSTWLDIDVRLAQDVTLLPNTQLLGSTTVAAGAAVGPDTTLTDTTVGERASVRRTESFSAVIGADATVGRWAYLRPGTRLGADGKIGTFVETKNAEIGTGSKVPHLSYIGDTEVGQGSNIGAGTITANYDALKAPDDGRKPRSHRQPQRLRCAREHRRRGVHWCRNGRAQGSRARRAAISVTPQCYMSGWVQQNRPDSAAAKAAETASEDQNL